MQVRSLCGFAALVLLLGSPMGAADCPRWPGEPMPLPRRDDADALRALWATLRIEQLSAVALEIESAHPVAANRLWRHVLCMDPARESAREGIARTPLIRVVRPSVERANRTAPAAPAGEPWSGLEEALVLPGASAAPRKLAKRSSAPWDARATDARIREAREHLRAARFSEALAAAAAARRSVASAPTGVRASRVAELEVLAATAELALGQDASAQQSLVRALRAQPDLALDPAQTSPKVMRALEAARATGSQEE